MTSQNFDLNPGMLGAGSSPKLIYVFFLLKLCTNYFETMRATLDTGNIDAATAALIAFCPDKQTREALWSQYTEDKSNGRDIVSASAITVGDLISYLSDTLEFTESSTGGFL